MTGIFHSQDLRVVGQESEHKVECYGSSTAFGPYDFVYFVPFEVDGYCTFDKYSTDWTFTIPALSSMTYSFAVYRQIDKISNTTATRGIGELVAGTTLTSASQTVTFTLTDTAALSAPVILEQGSYWIAFSFAEVGSITATCNAAIICTASPFSGWGNQSYLLSRASVALWPATMDTNASFSALAPAFQAGAGGSDMFWAGIFDSRNS